MISAKDSSASSTFLLRHSWSKLSSGCQGEDDQWGGAKSDQTVHSATSFHALIVERNFRASVNETAPKVWKNLQFSFFYFSFWEKMCRLKLSDGKIGLKSSMWQILKFVMVLKLGQLVWPKKRRAEVQGSKLEQSKGKRLERMGAEGWTKKWEMKDRQREKENDL